MVGEEVSSRSSWSREQDKAFENALGMYPEDCSDHWEKIAEAVPGKTMEEVKCHYELLVDDVDNIEAGRVPLPDYVSESLGDDVGSSSKGGQTHSDSHHGGKGSRSDQERRKGIAWTEEEHRFFLLGLDKYGKGDWRSISRNFVISRTPTQVASHAQKYFNRLNSMNKDKRRSSIHDITSVGNEDISAARRGPITGQTHGLVTTSGKLANQSPQPPAGTPGVGVYGTTIGQPVSVPLVSAMGTPVNLPIPAVPHMAYGMRLPFAGTVVPGAPVNITPVTYPIPPTPTHR